MLHPDEQRGALALAHLPTCLHSSRTVAGRGPSGAFLTLATLWPLPFLPLQLFSIVTRSLSGVPVLGLWDKAGSGLLGVCDRLVFGTFFEQPVILPPLSS